MLLLILGFFAAFREGTVTDWSALSLTGVFAASHAQASLGFVAFSVVVVGRFVGDRLTDSFALVT